MYGDTTNSAKFYWSGNLPKQIQSIDTTSGILASNSAILNVTGTLTGNGTKKISGFLPGTISTDVVTLANKWSDLV